MLRTSFLWDEGWRMIPKGGRLEKRLRSAMRLRLSSLDRPWLVELAMTENISASGARVLVKDAWRPGERITVEPAGLMDSCQGHIVYCDPLKTGSTAVGLQFLAPHPDWMH